MPNAQLYNHQRLPNGAVLLGRSDASTPEGSTVGSPGDLLTGRGTGARAWVKDTGNETNTGWAALAETKELPVRPGAPVGWGFDCDGILSTGATTQVSALTGIVRYMPINIPDNFSFDGFQVQNSVAEAGGAGIVHGMGLYRPRSDGLPDTNGGLLRSESVALTTTGTRFVAFGSGAIALPRGPYFLAWGNYWTTAPTTFSQPFTVTNSLNIPRQLTQHTQTSGRYFAHSGYTGAMINTVASPGAGWTNQTDSHMAHILLRRSA